ncbi:MAG: hypothetical protein M3R68_09400 [Acidobacteriota bacterium]|nr:hypothetical protein [Acidobacteriota bacterium]
MQAKQLTVKSYPSFEHVKSSLITENVSTTLKGWLNRLVGCWHTEMSRPFSAEGKAYRVCLNCGAQRNFSLKRWEMQGDFYYSLPTTKHFRALNSLAAVRRVTA